MANPIYSMMNQNNMLQRFNQFKASFKGDPREQIQQLLNSGRISQQQYNNAVNMAQRFQKMLKP